MFFVHQRGTLNGVYFAMTVIGVSVASTSQDARPIDTV